MNKLVNQPDDTSVLSVHKLDSPIFIGDMSEMYGIILNESGTSIDAS